MEIDNKFLKDKNLPFATTVGELREILAELPDELMLDDLIEVSVFVSAMSEIESTCCLTAINIDEEEF